jgi:hypothetical protein
VVECQVAHTDIAPTLLNLIGVDGKDHGMSGGTLVPEMTGVPCDREREIVVEMRYGPRSAPNKRALIGRRWKLRMNVKTGTFRLYDLERDPRERRNVAKKYPKKVAEMKRRLLAWSDIYANRELLEIRKENVTSELPPSAERWDIRFANGMEVVGVDLGEREVSRDAPLDAVYYLRTPERVRESCVIAHSIVNDGGKTLIKEAHPPIAGTFPVRQWPLDAIVIDGFALEVRKGSVHGDLELRLSLECDGEEVPVERGEVDERGRALLGSLDVKRVKR